MLNQPWADKSTTPAVLVHVHRFHQQTKPHTRNPPKRNQLSHAQSAQTTSTVPRAICPVGAAPVCPPEYSRSGISIPKIHAWCAGILTMDAPLWGDTGGHAGAAPTHLHHIFPRNPTQTKFRPCAIHPKRNQPSMCNPSLPISIKPHGVPLPRSGYTFDSAGLASATQPTLGNSANEEATPLGVVLFPPHCFSMSSHTHIGGGNASRTPAPIT